MSLPLAERRLNLTAGWKYSSGAIHAGFDYAVPIGIPVFAVQDGHILKTRDTIPNMRADQDGQSGDPPNFVLLGITFRGEPATVVYLHVSPDLPVREGDKVEAGQRIASTGHNGHSTGPHLHVSVLKGHNHENPFDYLNGLSDATEQPRHGLAANGLTIFPPRLVYGRRGFARGEVKVAELTFGTRNSDSVRRLQVRLNQISLVHGVDLPVTGNYLDMTRAEVKKWQLQKDQAEPGSATAQGDLTAAQAKRLFTKHFHLV